MKKIILSLLLTTTFIFQTINVSASSSTEKEFVSRSYNIFENNFAINKRGYLGGTTVEPSGDLVIPSTVGGVEVDTIHNGAFKDSPYLETVVIEGAKKIYPYAFYNCPNLTKVTLPEGLEHISGHVFENTGLTVLEIPSTVTEIQNDAFKGIDVVYFPYHKEGDIPQYTRYGGSINWGAASVVYGEKAPSIDLATLRANAQEKERIRNIVINKLELTVNSDTALVEGETVSLDIPAYINPENNSVYVPLRFVASSLIENGNENVLWDSSSKTVAIVQNNGSKQSIIRFAVGSNIMTVDGTGVDMGIGIAPEIKDGSVFVPFRALGEALGVEVSWDANTKTAIYS